MVEESVRLHELRANNRYAGRFWKYKTLVAAIYCDFRCQVFVAVLIAVNFIANIIEKQIDPSGSVYPELWQVLENLFTFIFAIELSINMYGFWFRPFWSSKWNVFDFVIVFVGFLQTFMQIFHENRLTGAMVTLRTFRAFRVFRLFKRVKELQKIVVALIHAVPGVFHVFVIMAIVMSIYALLAVEFYRHVGVSEKDQCIPKFLTSRGGCYGNEYFGNFAKALYTLFQIITGDSWSEAIVRLAVLEQKTSLEAIGSGIFFLSFIVGTSVILINVVVAVMLDKMACHSLIVSAEVEQYQTNGGMGRTEAVAEVEKPQMEPHPAEEFLEFVYSAPTKPSKWRDRFSEGVEAGYVNALLPLHPSPIEALEADEGGYAIPADPTPRGCCGCDGEAALLWQEVASVRDQIEAISSQLQELLAPTGDSDSLGETGA